MSKQTSSVHRLNCKPEFGSRFLTAEADVWSQNAWDHVDPPAERLEYVEESLRRQRATPVPPEEQEKYNDKPCRHWDNFYRTNTCNFFKDRKWLHLEFPEIALVSSESSGDVRILEIGCGAGNTAFPILEANRNPKLEVIACDYSHRAVTLVKANPAYNAGHIGKIRATTWDLASDQLPEGVEEGSVDILLMIFVLSALHPREWSRAAANVHKLLKPGGKVLLRDYGRHDLTQVRFKERRLLQDNFYIRGDNTRVYFFELDDLANIFTGSPVPPQISVDLHETEVSDVAEELPSSPGTPDQHTLASNHSVLPPSVSPTPPLENPPTSADELDKTGGFTIEQMGVDRRLLVNRKRQLKMYRVWMQAKFSKRVP